VRVLVRRLRNSYHRADLHTKLQSHALWISSERPWGPNLMVRAGFAKAGEVIPRRSARRCGRKKGSHLQVSTGLTARGTGVRGPRVVRNQSELQFNPGLISSTIHLIGTDVVQFPRVSQEAFQSLTLGSVSQRHPSSHDAQSQGRDTSSRAGSVRSPDQRLVTLLFRICTNKYLKPLAKFPSQIGAGRVLVFSQTLQR
jgi:hypothetical protein